jgi:hypothetical protein
MESRVRMYKPQRAAPIEADEDLPDQAISEMVQMLK